MAISEARKRANKKWNDAHAKERYDRIQIVVPIGEKTVFQTAAESAGESLSAYIAQSVRDRIARERNAAQQTGDTP